MADSSADELSEKIRQVCQKIDMTGDPEISSPHEASTQEGFHFESGDRKLHFIFIDRSFK